jgi:hypothetical protein
MKLALEGLPSEDSSPVRIAGDLPGSAIKSLPDANLLKAHQYNGFDEARSFSDEIIPTGCNEKEEASRMGILLTSFHQKENKRRVR